MINLTSLAESFEFVLKGFRLKKTVSDLESYAKASNDPEVAQKIITSKAGKIISKISNTIFHKTTSRILTLVTASLVLAGATVASGGLVLPAIGLAVAGAMVAHSIYSECKDVKRKKSLLAEKKYLQDHKDSVDKTKQVMEKYPDLEKTLGLSLPDPKSNPDKTSKTEKKSNEAKLSKSVRKAAASDILEIACPVVISGLTGNVPAVVASIAIATVGAGTAIARKHAEEKSKVEIKNQISELRENTPGYDKQHELAQQALNQKVNSMALQSLTQDPRYTRGNLSEDQIKSMYSEYQKSARETIQKEDRLYRQDKLEQPSFWQNVKSNLKTLGAVLNPLHEKEPSYKEIAESSFNGSKLESTQQHRQRQEHEISSITEKAKARTSGIYQPGSGTTVHSESTIAVREPSKGGPAR